MADRAKGFLYTMSHSRIDEWRTHKPNQIKVAWHNATLLRFSSVQDWTICFIFFAKFVPVLENLGKDVWMPKRKMLDFWNSGSGRFATWLQQACNMKSWGLRCLSWISGSGGVPTWFGTLCRYVEFPGAQHECYTQTSPASVMNFLGCNIQWILKLHPAKKIKSWWPPPNLRNQSHDFFPGTWPFQMSQTTGDKKMISIFFPVCHLQIHLGKKIEHKKCSRIIFLWLENVDLFKKNTDFVIIFWFWRSRTKSRMYRGG